MLFQEEWFWKVYNKFWSTLRECTYRCGRKLPLMNILYVESAFTVYSNNNNKFNTNKIKQNCVHFYKQLTD